MAVKPFCLADFTKLAVIFGLPQQVSVAGVQPVASKVLPIFKPSFNLLANCTAVLVMPVESAAVGDVL